MQKEFWLDRWKNRQIGFHLPAVNQYLINHWDKFVTDNKISVLVPLCGKSLDLLWFADKGHNVIGVEFSQTAVEEFFQNQGVQYEHASAGKLNVYKSGNITIYQGDFFDLEKEMLGAIDIVFDRAALVALPEDLRQRYCQHLTDLTANADIFLVSMEYDQSRMQGPPFSVSQSEIHNKYSATYKLQVLETKDLLSESPQFMERGLESMDEKVYKLSSLECS